MRGTLWGTVVVAIFAGLMLRALSLAVPSNPADSTQAVEGILNVVSPFAGMLLMLFAVGAAFVLSAGRGF